MFYSIVWENGEAFCKVSTFFLSLVRLTTLPTDLTLPTVHSPVNFSIEHRFGEKVTRGDRDLILRVLDGLRKPTMPCELRRISAAAR